MESGHEADYDDPEVEERWCSEGRGHVTQYLARQGLTHGKVGEWPAWHMALYVSIWAIESLAKPGWVGWWVIYGDLPTDYLSAGSIRHPRDAVAAFAEEWTKYVDVCRAGSPPEDVLISNGSDEFIDLLESRSRILTDWAQDEVKWPISH